MKNIKTHKINKLQVVIKYTLMIASIGVLIISCSKTEDDEMPQKKIEVDLSENAQKGPFLNGSSIAISELDQSFLPTGNDFNTQIIDNSGLFQINGIELATNYVTIRVDGFYFNEVCGESSNSQITLNGIADVSQSDFKNLNVITHLEKARVEFLIAEGMDFNAAKRQAQEEVLSIFNVSANIESSEELDIAENSDEIMYIVVDDHYIKIHSEKQSLPLVKASLSGFYEKYLSRFGNFYLLSRSCVINTHKTPKIENNRLYIDPKKPLSIPKGKKEEILEFIGV